MSTRTPAALALCLLLATAASAQVSDKYKEWREGPVQWIMTPDEQKAWRNLKSDDEAKTFVDLFWARRDPTPGTFENEFRAEHEGRVLVADRDWTEKDQGREKRGSMTDRGRVYIVLGNPTRMAKIGGRTAGSERDANSLGGTGRMVAGREEWHYLHETTKKWGVPAAVIVFLVHPQSGRVTRDVQRTDFIGASSGAMKSYIVDKNMKTVPEWAAVGGLNPITFRIVPAAPAAATAATPATPGTEPAVPAQAGAPVAGITPPAGIAERFEPKGISRLTLSHDVYEVDSETTTDPFLKLKPVEAFKASEELGWASQVCTGSNDEPLVKYQLRLTGTAAGEEIDRAGEPDELVPDRIRALNGCYMMRGAVPLEGMSAGNYQLEVAIYDPETRRDTVLKKAFRIE